MLLAAWSFRPADFEAAAAARVSFVRSLRERCECRREVEAAALIFGELVTNAARHATAGRVRAILCEQSGGSFHLAVSDIGPAFTPSFALPLDPYVAGGRGLYIAKRLALDLRIRPLPHGVVVNALLPCGRDARRAPVTG